MKLVEGNSDEILHQIDSAVYSVIEQKSLTDLGLGKGVSGLAYYFHSRLCTRENFNTPTALKIKRISLPPDKLDSRVASGYK